MPHRREKAPGSFRDQLGGVIERVAAAEPKARPRSGKPEERKVSEAAEVNDRLFERAWRKGD